MSDQQAHGGGGGQARRTVTVRVLQTGEAYACTCDQTILASMAKLGRKGIPVGCLNGGCGVCKIKVTQGRCRPTGPVSRAHVSEQEASAGITLACRAAPETDVELEVLGKMQRSFMRQMGRASNS